MIGVRGGFRDVLRPLSIALICASTTAAHAGEAKAVAGHEPAARHAEPAPGAEVAPAAVVTQPGEEPAPSPAPGGPAVEMITGGNSADGAAKVGRLPILD